MGEQGSFPYSSSSRGRGGRDERGFMLLVVPLLLGSLAMLAFQALHRSRTAIRVAGAELDYLGTSLCARRCAALAVNSMGRTLESHGRLSAGSQACACRDGSPRGPVDCRATTAAPAVGASPNCYGMETVLTEVGLDISCRDASSRSARLKEEVAYREAPIFQFAVFFDKVLEIHPGQNMEIRGRVHSNDTIRIYPGNAAVDFHDWITTPKAVEGMRPSWAAHAWAGFPRLEPAGSDAWFDISSPAFRPLHELIPAWDAWAARHKVAYGDKGAVCGTVEPLDLPLKGVEHARDLLEWRNPLDGEGMRGRKYAWRASLVWKDGGWMDRNLQSLSLDKPSRLPSGKVLAEGDRVTFWDGRDTAMVKVIPIDVRRLQQREGDSVIYLHDRLIDPLQGGKDVGGFLLYNARRLERPLTVASNSRIYGWGDFNTDSSYVDSEGRRGAWPAALVCDAYTQLSNEWDGTEYVKHARYAGVKSKNAAARAVLNACLMTGLPQRNGSWSGQGGYHNLVHFMEDWSGTVFEFSGSAVALWSSQVSTGYTSIEFYLPPLRKWSFDPMYGRIENMPPATPRLAGPRLKSWELVRL